MLCLPCQKFHSWKPQRNGWYHPVQLLELLPADSFLPEQRAITSQHESFRPSLSGLVACFRILKGTLLGQHSCYGSRAVHINRSSVQAACHIKCSLPARLQCKSSYIRAPKARESLGFYPKSYSGFGSSRSCAPPLVDDSALSPEELGSSPARIVQLSRSHGGKVDSRIGTRKRESPGRPYPREGEECKSSYIRAPKARESLGFYPKSYIQLL